MAEKKRDGNQRLTTHILGRNKMKIDISELRRQKRPLWMSEFDEDAGADILGGGGDIYTDRLPLDWGVLSGEESAEDEDVRELLEGGHAQEDFAG
jgi:hypothetical protein